MSTQMKEARISGFFTVHTDTKVDIFQSRPANSAMKYLVYGRIILDREVPQALFATGKS